MRLSSQLQIYAQSRGGVLASAFISFAFLAMPPYYPQRCTYTAKGATERRGLPLADGTGSCLEGVEWHAAGERRRRGKRDNADHRQPAILQLRELQLLEFLRVLCARRHAEVASEFVRGVLVLPVHLRVSSKWRERAAGQAGAGAGRVLGGEQLERRGRGHGRR